MPSSFSHIFICVSLINRWAVMIYIISVSIFTRRIKTTFGAVWRKSAFFDSNISHSSPSASTMVGCLAIRENIPWLLHPSPVSGPESLLASSSNAWQSIIGPCFSGNSTRGQPSCRPTPSKYYSTYSPSIQFALHPQ